MPLPLPFSEFPVSNVAGYHTPPTSASVDQTISCWASSYGYIPPLSSYPASFDPNSYGGPLLLDDFLKKDVHHHPGEGPLELLDDRSNRSPAIFERNVSAHHSRPSGFGPTGMTEVLPFPKSSVEFFPHEVGMAYPKSSGEFFPHEVGMAYPKSSGQFFAPKAGNAFAMNTSSAGRMVNSTSRSMDSMHYQPSSTCPSKTAKTAKTAKTTKTAKTAYTSTSTTFCPSEYNAMPRNDYWSVQNSGQFKYFDPADLPLTSWPIYYPYSEGKDLIADINGANSALPCNSVTNPFPIDGSFYLGNEISAGNSMNSCREVQHSITVDSPPWKDASTGMQFPSTCSATVEIHNVMKEKKNCSELGPLQSHFLTGVHSEPIPSPKQEGSLFGKVNRQSSPSSRPDSSTPAQLQNANPKANEMSGSSSNCSEKENQCSSLLGEQRTAPMSIQRESEIMDLNAKVAVQEGNPAAENLPVCLDRTADTEAGVTSSVAESPSDFNSCANELVSGDPQSGNNVKLFVKTMHCLSEALLSSCNIGSNELKEDDRKLLQLAIENLEAFIGNHKKLDASLSSVAIPEVDGMNSSKNISSCNVTKRMNCTASTLDGNEFENLITSLYEELCWPKLYQQSWTDAEDVSVSQKYQLASAELKEKLEKKEQGEVYASENYNQAKACPPSSSNAPKHAQFSGSCSQRTSHTFGDALDRLKLKVKGRLCDHIKKVEDKADVCRHSSCYEPFLLGADMADEPDASVMATYNILKGSKGKLVAASVEQKNDFVPSADLNLDMEEKVSDIRDNFCSPSSEGQKRKWMNFAAMLWNQLTGSTADTGGGLAVSCKSRGPDSDTGVVAASQESPDATGIQTCATSKQAKQDEVDASIMAIYNILKGWMGKPETDNSSLASSSKSRWSDTDSSDGELGASKELPVDAPVFHTHETNTPAKQSDAGDSDGLSSGWELLVEDDFTLV